MGVEIVGDGTFRVAMGNGGWITFRSYWLACRAASLIRDGKSPMPAVRDDERALFLGHYSR